MNKSLQQYKDMFKEQRPEKWNGIPDIDLYMDQVLSYMQRQHIGLQVDETLTSSMVNNYTKQGVMPKAKGKKYNREHIAYLTAICLLKQVISMTDCKTLLDKQIGDEEISSFYEKYSKILDEELVNVDNLMGTCDNDDEIVDLALKLAISSYTQKLACQCLIKSLEKEEEK